MSEVELKVKLSIITDEISQDLDEAAEVATSHGLHYVAIRSVWGKNVADLDLPQLHQIRQGLDRHGLKVSSLLSPLLKCHGPERSLGLDSDPHFVGYSTVYHDHIALAPKLPAMAEALGAPTIRIFSLLRAAEHSRFQALSDLVGSWPAGLGAVENEHTCTVATLTELAEVCTSSGIKVVLDPCNHRRITGSISANDLTTELVAAAVDVHVKDVRDEQYVPLGAGLVAWQEILDQLAGLGYDGFITLESHLRGDRVGVSESITALIEWTSQALAVNHPAGRLSGYEIGAAMWLDAASLGGR